VSEPRSSFIVRKQPSYGAWCIIPSGFSAQLVAEAGFDWLCVDTQHGLVGFTELREIIQAVRFMGVATLVRVSANSSGEIMRALDAGADGVVVPLVNGPEEAAAAVAACRYPPDGTRSWGPVRSAEFLPGEPAAVNAEVLCLVMIETAEGLAHADAICATAGVDGVYIGPADLGVAFGITPGTTSPEHAAAVETIRTACERHGIVPGIHTAGGAEARARLDQGFRFCSLATDAVLLRAKLRDELALARPD